MNGFSLLFNTLSALHNELTYGVITWLLGIIFVWSGIVKLRQPTLAAMSIADFGITKKVHKSLGYLLAVVELFLGVSLIARIQPQIIIPITFFILVAFSIAIAHSLLKGDKFACNCFGDTESELTPLTLVRTVGLCLMAVWLFALPKQTLLSDTPLAILEGIIAVSLVGSTLLVFSTRNLMLAQPAEIKQIMGK